MKQFQELFLHLSLLAMTVSMRQGTVTATELNIQEIVSLSVMSVLIPVPRTGRSLSKHLTTNIIIKMLF